MSATLQTVMARLEARRKEAELASADRMELACAIADEVRKDPGRKDRTQKRPRRGYTSKQVVSGAQMELFRKEKEGRFTCLRINPKSEYPRLFSRIPIFPPTKREAQKKLLDKDNALPFSTSWGQGRRLGPILTVFDEDVLIAVLQIRQLKIIGSGRNLPVRLSTHGNGEVSVHGLYCTLSDLVDQMGIQKSGAAYKKIMASLKRLNACVIELEKVGREKRKGLAVKLLDVLWEEYESEALLYIQFSPDVADWLEHEYVHLNTRIRSLLSDTGKAVYRFLVSQNPGYYEIGLEKLASVIGYTRGISFLKRDLKNEAQKLIGAGVIRDLRIMGTGRKTPYKLCVTLTHRKTEKSQNC